ncbi:hypothetical protein CHLRE_13g565250v5 [Chlamydomonas reinhardtii]|uniref:UspA domain-containing protein n=1 Tax=Chlamydomonas reinhardtii TaxID=3055 RepID=A0A2K3CZ86_CHLRE|nr:uncharacterized protein CHLRE_13g565250v5 [Chlamydomonas reinhardtii]PNW73592.1 hypothetical protein CHLRE_13g565250v5 [Chlamydomonas reinhardtii]
MMQSSEGAGPAEPARAVLLAVAMDEASLAAVNYAIHELYRKGDQFHLVHVARILSPSITIHHQYHATYNVPELGPGIDQRAFLERLKEEIKDKFTNPMDALGIPHNLHLFLDTDNAPASAVCETVFKVADQVDAAMVVLAAHGKGEEGSRDPLLGLYLGSVADFATRNSARPVLVVRSYAAPLVMHVSRSAARLAQGQVPGSAGGSEPGSRSLSNAPSLGGPA